MALFCIPPNLIKDLKTSVLKNELDIKKLYDMSSEERRGFFSERTNEDLGKFLNTKFEQAVVSKQKNAILEWAQSVFKPEAQKGKIYKNILDKINSLDEMGILTPKTEKAFLEDLVSDRLGVNVTPEETVKISELAKKVDEAQIKLGNDLGNPLKEKENIDFFVAKKEIDDYLNSLTPASNVRVATSTIGRGNMLASVKSPILNIGSNIELAFTESITRRLATGAIKSTDNNLALKYIKFVNKIYQKTGYDISRMENLADTGVSGGRVLGEKGHAQGPGIVRKVGRFYEDIVFKQLMGAPDVAFSAAHFADSVNLGALKMANGNKADAKTIMEDAMRIEPTTEGGKVLRGQAILDAQTATWTNTTWASKLSEGIRKIINTVSGDIRAGDFLLPFIKTPANVIATGMDYAGAGIPKAIFKTIVGIRNGEMGDPKVIKSITRDLVRGGLGITGALILAAQMDDDDFMGAYDPARAQIEALRNSTENSFRIGNKWISTNWLGPLSVPFTAMMYARKYGNQPSEKVFQYVRGVVNAAGEIPGIKDIFDYTKSVAYKKDQSLKEMTGGTLNYITDQVYSRLVPSILSDIAKGTDKFERETGGTRIGKIEAKIPGVRQKLEVKRDIFGQEIIGEPSWSDIMFGSRVRTNKETEMIKEINEVSMAVDKQINFTDWKKSSAKQLSQFKAKIGEEKFNKATIEYGQELEKQLRTAFSNPQFKRLDDDEKYKIISKQDAEAQEKVFKKYHFKYKQEKSKKVPKL